MSEDKILMVGCGILRKEIAYLIEKNHWPLETSLMASALHSELPKLEKGLRGSLAKHADRKPIVFYGCCHPYMDKILEEGHTFRTEGQNCVDMVLGTPLFTELLLDGAFFLFEDWALRWKRIIKVTFGDHPDIVRDIFQGDRKYILGLRTPCSGDFTEEAEGVARMVGLPLKWMDVNLDHLELVLQAAVERKLKEQE